MTGQAVKVKREKIEACMKCPICDKLLKEATTISLCLHTFCRKCICKKLLVDEEESCPVCNIDLGCVPEEKLRPDHTLQDIRSKIFRLKRRKINAPETLPSVAIPPPMKRKERSLSSLGFIAPKVSTQSGTTGKRTKAFGRRVSRGPSFVIEEQSKKRADFVEDMAAGSSSLDSLDKVNRKQESSPEVPSNEQEPNKENNAENEFKHDLWNPLNCLVEAANRTKASKLSSPLASLVEASNGTKTHKGVSISISISKTEPSNIPDSRAKVELPIAPGGIILGLSKTKSKEPRGKTKPRDNKNEGSSLTGPAKRKRVHKKAAASEDLSNSMQLLVDASPWKCNRRDLPIWFSLVASKDQKGEVSLPQISTCFLRVKDCSVPVSVIQKYIVQKLHLNSESEVEILCQGQPVLPSVQLHHLMDFWFRTAPATTKRVRATVGTSAKDFVMVLSYGRKVQPP